jgi:hypothetical protein
MWNIRQICIIREIRGVSDENQGRKAAIDKNVDVLGTHLGYALQCVSQVVTSEIQIEPSERSVNVVASWKKCLNKTRLILNKNQIRRRIKKRCT